MMNLALGSLIGFIFGVVVGQVFAIGKRTKK